MKKKAIDVYEYNLPKKKQPVFACFKGVVRVFLKKVKVVVLGGPIKEPTLFLANHANKMGPFVYETFMPTYTVKWGAHEMLGGYNERRKYLRDILYIKKNKTNKFFASIKSAFEAIFSGAVYKGMKFIGTYKDAGALRTVKKTCKVLDNDISVMVFPEDSDNGYFDEIGKFSPGFVPVAEHMLTKKGKDICVRPVYYHKKKSLIVVGKEYFFSQFKQMKMTRNEIAEFFKDRVNELYFAIESGEIC
ncbi:MAG: hypothetical protein MRZ91_00655 [Christensenellaceae bacterium]|nr:hypothetical protein [Christensenellaceae bacterium]